MKFGLKVLKQSIASDERVWTNRQPFSEAKSFSVTHGDNGALFLKSYIQAPMRCFLGNFANYILNPCCAWLFALIVGEVLIVVYLSFRMTDTLNSGADLVF